MLMRQMSRPRKPRKGEDKNALHWVFDAEKLAAADPVLSRRTFTPPARSGAIPSSSR